MVNEKKVRLMTQLALDETKRYQKELREDVLYPFDYIRKHTGTVLGSVTICYALLLFLFVLYHADYLFVNVAGIHYRRWALLLFGVWLLLMAAAAFASHAYYKRAFARMQEAVRQYSEKLKELEAFYEQDYEEADDDTTVGA